MSLSFPEPPTFSDAQRARGPVSLRYEDVTQDGRLHPIAAPHALGEVLWAGTLGAQRDMHRALAREGILPILSRLAMESFDGPIGVRSPLEGDGGFQLAHAIGKDGQAERIILNLWVGLTGVRARTHGPPPPGAGERIAVGRVFAEHVFTRPFAPAGERKVTCLPEPIGVPPARYDFVASEALLELPLDAEAIDAALVPDAAEVVFGLGHTDSNHHVNSLVYPRLFEEAALRRLAAHGISTAVLPRSLELGYRRPCFAGERVVVSVRAFRSEGKVAVVGTFAPVGAARPSITCRAWF